MTTCKVACYRYHFTSFSVQNDDKVHLIKCLKQLCKAWCFQLEKAPTTDRLHFQGRLNLIKKERIASLALKFKEGLSSFTIHLSVESNSGAEKNKAGEWTYVTKAETRVDGPWSDKDAGVYIPKEWNLASLRPWQQAALTALHDQTNREILCITDCTGKQGKSALWKHLVAGGQGFVIPSTLEQPKDLMRWACNMMSCKALDQTHNIIFDLPRAWTMGEGSNKDRWMKIATAIETIKDGMAYDERYSSKQVFFEAPRIMVFCNQAPPTDVFSADRWVFLKPQDFPEPAPPPAAALPPLPLSSTSFAAATTSSLHAPSPTWSEFEEHMLTGAISLENSEGEVEESEEESDMSGFIVSDHESLPRSPPADLSGPPPSPDGMEMVERRMTHYDPDRDPRLARHPDRDPRKRKSADQTVTGTPPTPTTSSTSGVILGSVQKRSRPGRIRMVASTDEFPSPPTPPRANVSSASSHAPTTTSPVAATAMSPQWEVTAASTWSAAKNSLPAMVREMQARVDEGKRLAESAKSWTATSSTAAAATREEVLSLLQTATAGPLCLGSDFDLCASRGECANGVVYCTCGGNDPMCAATFD